MTCFITGLIGNREAIEDKNKQILSTRESENEKKNEKKKCKKFKKKKIKKMKKIFFDVSSQYPAHSVQMLYGQCHAWVNHDLSYLLVTGLFDKKKEISVHTRVALHMTRHILTCWRRSPGRGSRSKMDELAIRLATLKQSTTIRIQFSEMLVSQSETESHRVCLLAGMRYENQCLTSKRHSASKESWSLFTVA